MKSWPPHVPLRIDLHPQVQKMRKHAGVSTGSGSESWLRELAWTCGVYGFAVFGFVASCVLAHIEDPWEMWYGLAVALGFLLVAGVSQIRRCREEVRRG